MKSVLLLAIVSLMSSTVSFAAAAPKSSPALLAKGKAAFTTNCALCHGEKGDGNGPAGMALNPKPRNFAKDNFKAGTKVDQVFNTITKGLPGTLMTAYGHISEEERWALAYYVLSFRK